MTYLTDEDCRSVSDIKQAVQVECVDRLENFDGAVTSEKPNSPANNISIYNGVILHSGEFTMDETDLQIPGRGFDFVFKRTYRSQAIYSGPLGFGWDHSYNRRLFSNQLSHVFSKSQNHLLISISATPAALD